MTNNTAAPQFPLVGADDDEIARRRHIPKEAQPGLIVAIRHHLYQAGYFDGRPYYDKVVKDDLAKFEVKRVI